MSWVLTICWCSAALCALTALPLQDVTPLVAQLVPELLRRLEQATTMVPPLQDQPTYVLYYCSCYLPLQMRDRPADMATYQGAICGALQAVCRHLEGPALMQQQATGESMARMIFRHYMAIFQVHACVCACMLGGLWHTLGSYLVLQLSAWLCDWCLGASLCVTYALRQC